MNEQERIDAIASHIEAIIELLGEDSSREGLIKTPERAAKALAFLTSGYQAQPEPMMEQALFEHEGSRMIVVKDIEFYSMCEHHILPFFGKVSIGYIPNGKIVGLSKLARIVDVFARRLQVQERFTQQICDTVAKTLDAAGVIVYCTADHLCMKMRGVEKQNSSTSTVHYNGVFDSNPELRTEFFTTLRQ